MSNTDRMSLLERWADGMDKLEQYYEGLYGPPSTPATLPSVTTYDGMLEAIADGMETVQKNVNKHSTTYHNTGTAYVKTIPAGTGNSASIEQIGGKTIVWNQMVDITATFTNATANVTHTKTDGVVDAESINNVSGLKFVTFVKDASLTQGNIYLGIADIMVDNSSYGCNLRIIKSNGGGALTGETLITSTNTTAYVRCYVRGKLNATSIGFGVRIPNGAPSGTGCLVKNIHLFDLTKMFGAGSEPATYADFISMFPAESYAYSGGELFSAGVTDVVSKGADNTVIETKTVPAEVRALTGYGWSCPTAYNYADFEAKKFVQKVGSRAYASGDESDADVITDGTNTYYEITPAVETDISAHLSGNTIQVESGGTLIFVNSHGDDYRIPVPSTETYWV